MGELYLELNIPHMFTSGTSSSKLRKAKSHEPCGSPWQDVFAFRHLSEELRNDREVLLHAAALGEWDFEGRSKMALKVADLHSFGHTYFVDTYFNHIS